MNSDQNSQLVANVDMMQSKLRFESVSAHRRAYYKLGEIPNRYAIEKSGSCVLMLCCQVIVNKSHLSVAVFGICKDLRTYIIDYWRFEDEDCTELNSPVWDRLSALIKDTIYVADDGKTYKMAITLIDAGYANDTVTTFCADYSSGVYPILGRDRPGKNQTIKGFSEFKTQAGTAGYKINVNHYKDRLDSVLRREWLEDSGPQNIYHFNAAIDIPDKHLKELTVEIRKKVHDNNGNERDVWCNPKNARNELRCLLVYCHASVEIMARSVCIEYFNLEKIDWFLFWDCIEMYKRFFDDPIL